MFLNTAKRRPYRACSDEELHFFYYTGKDEACFSELFHRHAQRLFELCRDILRDHEESKDMVMYIFEKCLRNPPPPASKIEAWFFLTARNECVDKLRRQRREQRWEAAYWQEWKAGQRRAECALADFPVIRGECARETRLREAITRLKTRQRKCLELFYFEKKSYREIAGETHCTEKEVKAHLQSGRRMVRKMFVNPHVRGS
jgi:RNA polymerase sigma-70 factor (ECF subfamily)